MPGPAHPAALSVGIRDETPTDAAAIRALTEAAFRDAPHSEHREQDIVDALRAAGALSVSLVAEVDGMAVGHVAASPVTIDERTGAWFGLGPVSVHPKWQRQGIGSGLIHAVLQRLADTGSQGCVVLGEPAYYARFGFRATDDLVLPGVPPAYFQALVWTGPMPAGTVAYHAAFAG